MEIPDQLLNGMSEKLNTIVTEANNQSIPVPDEVSFSLCCFVLFFFSFFFFFFFFFCSYTPNITQIDYHSPSHNQRY